MQSSKRPSEFLDFENDLPTTPEDVRTLRRLRAEAANAGMESLQRLETLKQWPAAACRHSVFGDIPPFEL